MNTSTAPPTKTVRPEKVFSTERLQLAIYLHASQRLPFHGCEAMETGKLRFVFQDPTIEGPQAELDYDRGAEVAASNLFASQKYLRRAMSMANNRRIEEPNYEHKQ